MFNVKASNVRFDFRVRLVMLGFSGLEIFWHSHYGDIPTLHKTSEIFRYVMLYVKNLKFLTLEIFIVIQIFSIPHFGDSNVNHFSNTA